ncbi:hypothetical protein HBB16_17705 [Pseudonocardia sp. MCCB 268]|nr:hypothetical protein [Pseudonocardia cytotoxica]
MMNFGWPGRGAWSTSPVPGLAGIRRDGDTRSGSGRSPHRAVEKRPTSGRASGS